MTPRYPGARWYGQSGNGGSNSHRACSWHEVVNTAPVDNIAGWNAGACACHGFTHKDGDCGQFVDFGEAVNGVKDDNGSVLTWENYDGLTPATNRSPDGSFGPNDRDWTPQQFERNADIMAWMEHFLGIPLRLMQWTNERGHGPHRLGVRNPNGRVKTNTGPASWTRWDGKECPGDLRVLSLPSMIARAQAISAAVRAGKCTWLPQGPVDLAKALARTGGVAHTGTDTPTTPKDDSLSAADVAELKKYIDQKLDTYSKVSGESYSLVEMMAFIDFNVNRAVDAAVAAAAKAGATVPPRKAVARKPKAAPAKPPAKPPAPPAKPTSHKVQQGETLSTIAGKYGTTWQALAQLNKLSNPDVVNPGDVLQLPK